MNLIFFISNWRKHFVRAHQWNFLLNGRCGALITPTLYYLLCFAAVWNSQWNIQNEIEKHIIILWFIKCMIWIECFQMKHKYWDQYTVIIVSSWCFSFLTIFRDSISYCIVELAYTYSSLLFTLLDNSHYSSWWCVIRGLHSFKVANEMMAMTINSPATATNNNREIAGKVKIPHKLFMHMIPF